MFNISAKTIPHHTHRYPTVGDYFRSKDNPKKQNFRISDMGNKDYEMLVLIHELIEAHLCEKRKISWDKIDDFDKEFERNRKEGNVDEPGNDKNAPYYHEHRFAENIERQLAHELGVDWFAYDKQVNEL